MKYRMVRRVGIELSQIGLGCNRLGEEAYEEAHWSGLVEHAVDLGINVFDTAQAYGGGRSEEMLGKGLGKRDGVYVASKIGHSDDGFTPESLAQKIETSLTRLGRDCVEILQLHSPTREELERYEWAEGMERLQRAGKIRCKAMALDSVATGVWLLRQGIVDLLQITYNIFDVEAERELFGLAVAQGVGLVCRLPLAQGVLTGKFAPGAALGDHRARFSGPRLERRIEMAESLRPLAERYPGGMTRLAHDFSLASDAVTCIIPGARDIAQLEENAAAGEGAGMDAGMRAEIEALRRTWGEWEGGYWFPGYEKNKRRRLSAG